ncbi:hypothetical protein A3J90_07030 [candidate division WOR-1 bacterium RIFOXYC2_FULL_37_10]|uniref:3-oxoacyl-ACP reductase n=1 Tax=candidate division WOR-1 bacterium RIFOXYB2_FULL_37_13 TaxID=1802579 RepID=A0A1F4SQB7_UNCSA|nr:MAG: hypothetical protein A2310_07595 [candidate division WOR-1 bacterium RIFOXYB2_FULL_37_13]OGC34237.1 MAG: hypothetical protein A3J90_07030 [candidate division WOR-1 bacterium RIFOXYC2_FULL_37_10]
MNFGLKDKVAVIGGSSKGLGKGCAISLAKEGVHIVLCANGEQSLAETAHLIETLGVKVLPLEVDMSSKDDNEKIIKETIDTFGKIDILVNNSGGPLPGTFFDFSDKDWEKAFNDVLMYVVRLTRGVIPYMKKNKWGRIINITSLVVKEPAETLVLSNVFRTGVVSLAKTLSKELIKNNITINNICPGAFKTDRAIELMKVAAKEKGVTIEDIEKEAIKTMPLGRYQKPEELGALVAFLCSELASGITGTTIQIDGGISKGLF